MISHAKTQDSFLYSNPYLKQKQGLSKVKQETCFLRASKSTMPDMSGALFGNEVTQQAKNPTDIKNKLKALEYAPTDYQMVNGKKVFNATTSDKKNGFLQLFDNTMDEKLAEIKNKPKYKYKEVSAKIRAAKTSVSAGQALIAAKRSVSDIKRQIRSAKEGSDELLLALSHARRMEMAARKKKHHLELEEIVEAAQKVNTTPKSDDTSNQDSANIARAAYIDEAEGKIEKAEDKIFEEREQMIENMSDDMAQMISEYGEEELKQLEEAMEMYELMEVVDPNMSKEDFKKLKMKHRNAEEKAIVKADMEYLKGIIKLAQESGALNMPSIPTGGFTPAPSIMQETSLDIVI